jgi:hypothetical protein
MVILFIPADRWEICTASTQAHTNPSGTKISGRISVAVAVFPADPRVAHAAVTGLAVLPLVVFLPLVVVLLQLVALPVPVCCLGGE